ncbi:hypothetical protein MTR_7g026530 [Medicago truncatula]|uniref:Uncharacterized protein n=1 Tax=Medicago truncatula TaxID=3880 RepID=G7L039_MEDTR|nr:hypothetical protein MTR_7g026530 [Medicago truncatula]
MAKIKGTTKLSTILKVVMRLLETKNCWGVRGAPHITSLIHTRIPLPLPTEPNHGSDTTVGESGESQERQWAKRPRP